jgi:hypothetical protein
MTTILSTIKHKDYNHTVTWLKFEQNILNEYGMPYIWYTHTFINSYWIVNAVKLILKDKLKQSWNTSIQNSPKTFFSSIFQGSIEIGKKIFRNFGSQILIRPFQASN